MRATIGAETEAFSRSMTFDTSGISKSSFLSSHGTRRVKKSA